MKDLLGDLNPQLLNTITTEFDKVEGTPAPEPIRSSVDLANMVATSDGSGKTADSADPLDNLFPRVEIDVLLKGTTILADAKSDAWKTKKEALESFQAMLDQGSNKRLKPGMGTLITRSTTSFLHDNRGDRTSAQGQSCRYKQGRTNSGTRYRMPYCNRNGQTV
jgi:cytoskeleton-associated protein 5